MPLFCIVILLNHPAVPAAAPSETIMEELELTPLVIIQFFTVTFVIGVVPVEPMTITCGVVVLVFVIDKFLVVPFTVFEPSIET